MAVRPPQFTAIPNIPQQGLTDWQFSTLNAMKQNLELLIGARGNSATSAAAITRGSITVVDAPAQTMQRVTAEGSGFTISGVTVPSLEDYGKLVNNVQQLANDVATLRNTVNALTSQLRGRP
jgi:hypothetical protein